MEQETKQSKFALEIRVRRHKMRLSLQELGKLVGCSPAHLGHIERGIREPSLDLIERLGYALHIGTLHYGGITIKIDAVEIPTEITTLFQTTELAHQGVALSALERALVGDLLADLLSVAKTADTLDSVHFERKFTVLSSVMREMGHTPLTKITAQ